MTYQALLAALENRPDSDRLRHMIALGRQARTDPQAAETLAALAAGGFYERRLALLACAGSRDSAQALKALSDPSRLLRSLAIGLIPILCTDSDVTQALEAAPRRARVALLARLVHRRRRAPIDAFLDRLAERHDPDLGSLLSFGSVDAVRRHLEASLPRFGVVDWQRLARRHPNVALEQLEWQAGTLDAPNARLRHQINAVLPLLAHARPEAALALVRTVLRHASAAQLTLQELADRRPNEVAEIVLASDDTAAIRFDTLTHKLTQENLLSLVQRTGLLGPPSGWMRRLTPQRRRAVYGLAALGWRNAEGVLELTSAALLPGELRTEEARRHLTLPALVTRPAQRLPYAALLPWDEARGALEPALRNPDAELRAAALAALIGATRYQRERLPEALAAVRIRANEQDPVRREMLTALAGLPPARWTAQHLDDLDQIVLDALSAADLSPATASAAEKLIIALVPFHPDWAASWLGTLAKERGQIHFRDLGDRLSDDEVRRIAPALLPVLRSWETRERESLLIQAARSFGRRLRVLPELVEMLERVLAVTPHSYTASQILTLLNEHRHERLSSLVPALIRQDASSVTLPVIHHYLHRHRQDLLTPFLGQQAYGGRFSTGRTRFVLPLTGGFERWTPGQQETFASTLDGVTRDTARDTPSIFLVIGQLAALPAITPTRLIALADRRTQKVAVREAALRALARLDGGQGVPVLVEALDDERARIAIYALRTVLLEMPPIAALILLRAAPREKVTVAKEVVRLIGDLKTPDAYLALLAFNATALHRDVRVALLRALWAYLEEDATWPILERAAADPDPAVACGVTRIPTDRLSPRAQQRLVHLIVALLEHGAAQIRMDTLARCLALPLHDPGEVLLPRLLARMGSRLPDESAAAARAVFATYSGAQATAVGEAVRGIRENRRALGAVVSTLNGTLAGQRGRQQSTVRAVVAALEGDPLTAVIRAPLVAAALPGEEAALLLTQMFETGELHAEALLTAVCALERMKAHPAEALERLEALLSVHPSDGLRRLALAALIAQAATAEGWTEARRGRLAAYQRDRAPLVAGAAQFTFPPDEEPVLVAT